MQLTNIARDVGEDARLGRIYLPLAWLREAGIDPDVWLAAPAFSPELGSVISRLLDAADELYERADAGIAGFPLLADRAYAQRACSMPRSGTSCVVPGSTQSRAAASFRPAASLRLLASAATRAAGAGGCRMSHASSRVSSSSAPLPSSKGTTRDAPQWWDLPGGWVRIIDLVRKAGAPRPSEPRDRNMQAARLIGV